MANTTAEILEERLEENTARYRELTEKVRALRIRLEKAEAQKRSVSERIYEKVRGEYLRQIDEAEKDLEPLAAEVGEIRASIQQEIREIDTRTQELQEKIDEIAFRYRVGEYDADMSESLQTPLADEYERLSRKRGALSERLAGLELGDDGSPSAAESASEQTVRKEPPRDEPARTEPVHHENAYRPAPAREEPAPPEPVGKEQVRVEPAERAAAAPAVSTAPQPAPAETDAADAFVDPTEWVGEFIEEESSSPSNVNREVKTEETAESDPVDSLSELADPSDDAGAEREFSSQRTDPRNGTAPTLPILTVVKGPSAGRRLPLLPMTMTLGREVDNNIEIKDGDVARYHARISFEGGQYTIQDLEGSSGTFVNGQRITKTVIAPGSTIRVGNSELKLELG
jgi:hypothetical protein